MSHCFSPFINRPLLNVHHVRRLRRQLLTQLSKRPTPGVHAVVQQHPPLECGLHPVTHFYPTEYSTNDEMPLPCQEAVVLSCEHSLSGALSCLLACSGGAWCLSMLEGPRWQATEEGLRAQLMWCWALLTPLEWVWKAGPSQLRPLLSLRPGHHLGYSLL